MDLRPWLKQWGCGAEPSLPKESVQDGGDGAGPGADFNRPKGERGPGMMTPDILEPSVGSR